MTKQIYFWCESRLSLFLMILHTLNSSLPSFLPSTRNDCSHQVFVKVKCDERSFLKLNFPRRLRRDWLLRKVFFVNSKSLLPSFLGLKEFLVEEKLRDSCVQTESLSMHDGRWTVWKIDVKFFFYFCKSSLSTSAGDFRQRRFPSIVIFWSENLNRKLNFLNNSIRFEVKTFSLLFLLTQSPSTRS